MTGAFYKDLDLDGKIDYVEVAFHKDISKENLAAGLYWNTNSMVVVPQDSIFYPGADQKVIGMRIEGLLTDTQIVTGGMMHFREYTVHS